MRGAAISISISKGFLRAYSQGNGRAVPRFALMDFLKAELVRVNRDDMEELTGKFQTILSNFLKIPQIVTEPTWMEICRYPQSRFEEVCSRILAFYLNPNAEHRINDLWLSALLDAVGKSDWYDYRHDVKVNTEEYADGKRIDITIVSDDYVVAIENKITADLYNPLDVYRSYISKTYPKKNQLLVVLSLKPILDKHLLAENDFQRCSYQDLFDKVNSRIGHYMAGANQKYLTCLVDFMKTIDNMNNNSTQLEKNFFANNRRNIDELIKRYEQYKAGILQAQIDNISSLRERMNALTGGNWWIYDGWLLGVTFNEEGHKIGIEARFEEAGGNPVAGFRACVTTWKKANWSPYRETVLKEFADCNPVVEDSLPGNLRDRVYVWVYRNDDGNLELIANALKDIYNRLYKVISSIY